MVLPLLLKNSFQGIDQNACFANSIINILRRVSIFKETLPAFANEEQETKIPFFLQQIFSKEGSFQGQSASFLRQELANKTRNANFSSGVQYDAKEFLDALFQFLPSLNDIFEFTITRKYSFVNSKFSPRCQFCQLEENPVPDPATTIHLNLLPSNDLSLQNLIDHFFQFQVASKKCSKQQCEDTPLQIYHECPSMTNAGPYLLIQLLRFKNNGQKVYNLVQK